ncbi:hypothetical protein [Deinococcus roseus]|uniref:Transposase n=1 Tax=Deinococcus roseus TaxID=392414 RepID=A0ABQ2D5R2_9DEIO|nr:hypothetical protein [Deinococcus roseus]GGJ44015.1 hypothetical protein GCM10008938_32860 [Deinococcus roseus]
METQHLLWIVFSLAGITLITWQWTNFVLQVLKLAGKHGPKSFQRALELLVHLLHAVVSRLLPSWLPRTPPSPQNASEDHG